MSDALSSGGVTAGRGLDAVLARLQGVRRCGRGYIAKCPAHEDRSASLSITEGDDGRILLNDFGGCAAADVVGALGLTWSELFPRRISSTMTHAEKAAMREGARQAQWRAALGVLAREATVAAIAAQALRAGPLNAEDGARLNEAVCRIEAAKAVLCGR